MGKKFSNCPISVTDDPSCRKPILKKKDYRIRLKYNYQNDHEYNSS